MSTRFGVFSLAETRLIFDRFPGNPPFILITLQVLITFLIIAVHPAHRSEQHILIQGALELIGIAAAVRIVQPLASKFQIRLEARGEFRCETYLHRAAVRFLMIKRGQHAVAMFHCDLLHLIISLKSPTVSLQPPYLPYSRAVSNAATIFSGGTRA